MKSILIFALIVTHPSLVLAQAPDSKTCFVESARIHQEMP
jgi:hypothetical protein